MNGTNEAVNRANTKPIEQVTLVYGRDLRGYSENEMLITIENMEKEILRFKSIAADSAFIKKRVAELQAAVQVLIKELDSRTTAGVATPTPV